MSEIQKLLDAYERGDLLRGELIGALSRRVPPDDVAGFLRQLPPDFANELVDWAESLPEDGGLTVSPEVGRESAQWRKEQGRVASRAIREWSAITRR